MQQIRIIASAWLFGVLFLPAVSIAQVRVGVFTDWQMNIHQTSGTWGSVRNQSPACDSAFGGSTGLGAQIGLIGEYPLNDNVCGQLRIGLSWMGATLKRMQFLGYTGLPNAQLQQVSIERSLAASLSAFTIAPAAVIRPFSIPFRFEAGTELSLMMTRRYKITETPTAGVGIATSRETPGVEQTIPGATGTIIGLRGGIGYEFTIRNIVITPEVGFTFSLNDIASGVDWKSHGLRFGLTAVYDLTPAAPLDPPPPPPPVETRAADSAKIDPPFTGCLLLFTDPLVNRAEADRIAAQLRKRGIGGVQVRLWEVSAGSTPGYRVVAPYATSSEAQKARKKAAGAAKKLHLTLTVQCSEPK